MAKYIEELPIEKRDIYITPNTINYMKIMKMVHLNVLFIKNNNICIFPFLINKINNT